ncbi:alpha/beta hydrolase [Butyrivibrio sp. VCD2006]|uniref:alpha/beta hydrolase n=1 Tax=Butyrivibrio sp. VCD2006 TaxID=1280664 RepID=UPI000412F2C8|nr:alpha/beta hydrolase [Butyrivibrio sp. VCD2006]
MKSGTKKNKGTVVKRILIIIAAVLVILDIIAGNYLVSFALMRSSASGVDVAPEPVTTKDTQDKVDEVWKSISSLTDEWVESAEKETVSLTSKDGLKLVGDVFNTDKSSHKWLIAVHGYTSKRQHMYPYARYYAKRGYNVVAPDNRAHGESEGKMLGMGWLDKDDIKLWIDYIVNIDPEAEIVLHGVSMGGATVMMVSGEELPANVKAIVDDCGYTSVWDEFTDEARYLFHIPQFPILHTASLISKLRAGYTFWEASAIDQVRKTKIPIMFIHGSKDNFVNADMVYELYDACPTQKDIYVVEGAGHGQAMYLDPDLYFEKVFNFIDLF